MQFLLISPHMKKASKKHNKIIDHVCGMGLSSVSKPVKASYKGEVFLFCDQACKARFIKDPKKFLGEPLIKLINVKKTFTLGGVDIKVLRGFDLRIWEGDFVVLIGASGSGKSTALNMMGLLDRPTSGHIYLKGKDVALMDDEHRAKLRSQTFGFVFQQYNLIPWLTAFENVTLPMIFAANSIEKEKVVANFKRIGLLERMNHRPFELSGGEQQRVAMLRSLSNDPDIIIGDEPTGNLDSATGEKILKILIDLNKIQKKTLIIVTHDADIAKRADQVITLKDGKIIKNHGSHQKMYTE